MYWTTCERLCDIGTAARSWSVKPSLTPRRYWSLHQFSSKMSLGPGGKRSTEKGSRLLLSCSSSSNHMSTKGNKSLSVALNNLDCCWDVRLTCTRHAQQLIIRGDISNIWRSCCPLKLRKGSHCSVTSGNQGIKSL